MFTRFYNDFGKIEYAAAVTDGGKHGKLFIVVTNDTALESWLILKETPFSATGEYQNAGVAQW